MIPAHDADGFLPAGEHVATWAEVVERFGTNGRREVMLKLLHEALSHFAAAGCRWALLGGSFVTTKRNPGDLDVAWDTTGVDPELVHPAFLFAEGVDAVWNRFAGHYFPASLIEGQTQLPFGQFFQQNRDGRQVGIVKIDLSTL